MYRYLMIFAFFLIASCGQKQIEYVRVLPDLPVDLRTPVGVPSRAAETLADVGVILTDHVQALGRANGKIVATDCIWKAAEAGTPDEQCLSK